MMLWLSLICSSEARNMSEDILGFKQDQIFKGLSQLGYWDLYGRL